MYLKSIYSGENIKLRYASSKIIAGLDIGTSQIRVAIGKLCDGGTEIIGVGQSASNGLRKGAVVDVDNVAAAVVSQR